MAEPEQENSGDDGDEDTAGSALVGFLRADHRERRPADAHPDQEPADIGGLGDPDDPDGKEEPGAGGEAVCLGEFDQLDEEVEEEGDVDQPEEGGHKAPKPSGLEVFPDDGQREEKKAEQKKVVSGIQPRQVVSTETDNEATAEPEGFERAESGLLEELVELELGEEREGGDEKDARVDTEKEKRHRQDGPERGETENTLWHKTGGAAAGPRSGALQPLYLLQLIGGLPVAALPPGIIAEGGLEVLVLEIRPEDGADVDLRIGGLEEEEVTQPTFSRGADDEVRIRQIPCVEVAPKASVIHALEVEGSRACRFGDGFDGIDHLAAGTVVQGKREGVLRKGGGCAFDLPEALLNVLGQFLEASDDAEPDPVLDELFLLFGEEPVEQLHQRGDLVLGAVPVFNAEGEEGEVADAVLAGGFKGTLDGIRATPVAFDPGKAPLPRPAPVAVHDNGDMARLRIGGRIIRRVHGGFGVWSGVW